MTTDDLDKQFNEAVEKASKMVQTSIPQDVQLRLYAFYKQATLGSMQINGAQNHDIRSAFKTNSWMQISHLSSNQAKIKYIEVINSILKT